MKGIERAEHAEDKLEKKIERSRGKEKVVKERRVSSGKGVSRSAWQGNMSKV